MENATQPCNGNKPRVYRHLTITNREPLDFKCLMWRGYATVWLPRSRVLFVTFCSINVQTLRVYGFYDIFVRLWLYLSKWINFPTIRCRRHHTFIETSTVFCIDSGGISCFCAGWWRHFIRQQAAELFAVASRKLDRLWDHFVATLSCKFHRAAVAFQNPIGLTFL